LTIFRRLAVAGAADMDNAFRIGCHHRSGSLDRRLGAAAHDRQRTIFGPGLTASHRRIDAIQPAPLGFDRQLPRDASGYGGMIDEGAALGHRGKYAIAAKRDAGKVIIGADAADDKFGVLCRLCRRRGLLPAMFGHPFVRFGRRTVVDGHHACMTAPTHHAQ
jgi:hypothetical protein